MLATAACCENEFQDQRFTMELDIQSKHSASNENWSPGAYTNTFSCFGVYFLQPTEYEQ